MCDRGKKRRLYLEAGVEEYWIIDIDARLIERWRSGEDKRDIIDGQLQWKLGDGLSDTLDVERPFDGLVED